MNGYRLSPPMQAALDLFLHHLRDEPVPDQPGVPGDEALDPDFRKAVAMLRVCGRQAEASPAMPSAPELMLSRFEPGMKEVRKVDLTELNMTEAGPGSDPSPEPPDQPPAIPPDEQGGAQSPVISPENAPILQKDEQPAIPVAPAPSLLAVRHSVTLRNARVGEDYSDNLLLEGAIDLALSDSGGSGLAFDPTDWTFTGVPSASGDFELRLTGKIGGRPADITAKLAVIPDPKSLWTSLPSDQSAAFWKPDEDFRFVATDHLRMFAASKRGRSHAKTGGFREDDFALATHGPWHIAVVADGAGSARFSRRGSRLAVETIVAELPALIDRQLGDDFALLVAGGEETQGEIARRLYESLVTAAFKAADALAKDAEKLEEPASSLSTTLILTVARRLADRWFVAAFSIGDGGAALLDLDSGQVQPLTVPDSGEYAGQTRFLARSEFADPAEVMKRLRYATPENFTALALMSDGITDPKLPTDNAFADPTVWASFWSEDLAKLVDFSAPEDDVKAQFLAWLDFWSPGNHDDRTLAVLLPRER